MKDRKVEKLYALAKGGHWDEVLSNFEREVRLAGICSRYCRPSSRWTFLHQAAYFGREEAARALIRLGGSLSVQSAKGETPADVAHARGHAALSHMMRSAARGGASRLWEPSPDPELLPSSYACEEAVERRATGVMRVAYGGGVVTIPAGSRYFVDSFGRVLVGWHGSYDPPSGMDGDPGL